MLLAFLSSSLHTVENKEFPLVSANTLTYGMNLGIVGDCVIMYPCVSSCGTTDCIPLTNKDPHSQRLCHPPYHHFITILPPSYLPTINHSTITLPTSIPLSYQTLYQYPSTNLSPVLAPSYHQSNTHDHYPTTKLSPLSFHHPNPPLPSH